MTVLGAGYPTVGGQIRDVARAAAVFCRRQAREAIRQRLQTTPSGPNLGTQRGELPFTPPASRPATKRGGRRRNEKRRSAIHNEIAKRGDEWRNQLSGIFEELDRQEVDLGGFAGKKINLGDDQYQIVSKWEDLDLAVGKDRRQIIDALRWYVD